MKFKEKSGNVYIWTLTGPEFIHNFTKFNNTFKSNKTKAYKKIEYNTWCDLNKHNSGVHAELRYDSAIRQVYLWAGKQWCDEIMKYGTSTSKSHTFSRGDVSFGDFLYIELIKHAMEENDKMTNSAINAVCACGTEAKISSATLDSLIGSITTKYSDISVDGGSLTADKAICDSNYYTIGTTDNDRYNGIDGIYTDNTNDTVIWNGTQWDKVATYSYVDTKADIEDLNRKIREHENKYHNEKESEKNMKFGNFDFGPCTNDNIRMSMYGLAVKNVSGTWVSFDTKNNAIMDVDIFNFDGGKYLYKMPVAIKDVRAGDVIIHCRKPMFVSAVNNNMTVLAVDPVDGELKEIMLTRSPFGFNFVTKVVNLFDGMMTAADGPSESNPFGNMWMFMLLGDNTKTDDLLPLMLMSNNSNMNPMMLYLLMSDNKNSKDMLLPLMLMNGQLNYGCNCQEK